VFESSFVCKVSVSTGRAKYLSFVIGKVTKMVPLWEHGFTRFMDENLVLATELVRNWTAIPVPRIIAYDPKMTVLEMIEGIDFDAAWSYISKRYRIKYELYIYSSFGEFQTSVLKTLQIMTGTLCRTHEILFSSNRNYHQQSLFKRALRSQVQVLAY